MPRIGLAAWLSLLLLAVAALGQDPDSGTVVVEAPGLGRVRGRRVRLPNGEQGAKFMGVPYAAQPVRRFEPARVWDRRGGFESESGEEEWDATTMPPPCPQMMDGAVVGSEDCLYAIVYLPPHNASAPPLLPVYVFIHGGAYILGEAASPQFDGASLAAKKGLIVVTLAYRLGALGFLAHPDMDPTGVQGNLALLDLRVGLEWIQRYIRAFGGDPERVTVGGQSAGAYLGCLLLAMQEEQRGRGAKPFRALIMESGGCYAQPLALAHNRTRAWMEEVGCASNDDADDAAASLACLRRLPVEALVPASTRLGAEEYHYWQPTVVENDPSSPLPAAPSELLRADERLRRAVPVIAGTNEDEGTLFLAPTGLLEDDSDSAYVAWVTGGGMQRGQGFPFLTAEEAEEVLRLYPPAGAGHNRWNAAAIIADAHYKCPTLALARIGWRALHLYRFAYFQMQCNDTPSSLRCYHGSELPYIFNHPRQTPCHERAFLSYEQVVSDTMGDLWAGFIHTGHVPDEHNILHDEAGAAAAESAAATARLRALRGAHRRRRGSKHTWPAFQEGRQESMLRIQAWNVSNVPVDRREVCEFWDTTRVYR